MDWMKLVQPILPTAVQAVTSVVTNLMQSIRQKHVGADHNHTDAEIAESFITMLATMSTDEVETLIHEMKERKLVQKTNKGGVL